MDEQGLDDEVWRTDIVQKYEKRPVELNDICLAHYVPWSNYETGSL